jgi:trehalose 6-phosphate phosphatase
MSDVIDLPPPPPLDRLADAREIALFLDFDGTLVELAHAPGAIVVPPDLGGRLRTLAERLGGRLALVSGRSLDDLGGHCPIDGIACAGSHGAARRDAGGAEIGEPALAMVPEALDLLRAGAREFGLMLEAKPHGAALHYRTHPERAALAETLADEVATRFGLAIKPGKGVVELTQTGADKGGAVRAFLALPPFAGALPVFVGDDVTDEDGMVACEEAGGFGILVGDRTPTAARYRLPHVSAVYEWLSL